MRTVSIPGTELQASCIGMGCASLGSRISKKQGLRALSAAYARGVTWYDVAPPYGAGDAESILGAFLVGRRRSVIVCSKVGLSTPANNKLIKMAYRAGRPVVSLAQGLRRRFRQLPSTRNVRIPLTAASIEMSVKKSLDRLGTDYLDILALHDPDPADLGRDDILAALEKVKTRGQARYLALAGSFQAAEKAAVIPDFSILQLADPPTAPPLPRLRRQLERPVGFITHSVFGVAGAKAQLMSKLAANPKLLKILAEGGFGNSAEIATNHLLLQRAFVSNPNGVVLASMFSGNHLEENIRRAASPLNPAAAQILEQIYAP